MTEAYRIDHHLKIRSDDLIWHIHEYDISPAPDKETSSHVYLLGSELRAISLTPDELDEPGVEFMMVNRFLRNLNLCMRINDRPILIHMKTSGGSWPEGMAVYDAIQACPNPITILNYTHARSMSSLIFQAANKRVMMPNSYFMFHEGTCGIEGTFKQVQSFAEFDKKIAKETMLKIYVDNIKSTSHSSMKSWSKSRIKKWVQEQIDTQEDVYLTPEETKKIGLADEIFGGDGTYDWGQLTKYTDEQLDR